MQMDANARSRNTGVVALLRAALTLGALLAGLWVLWRACGSYAATLALDVSAGAPPTVDKLVLEIAAVMVLVASAALSLLFALAAVDAVMGEHLPGLRAACARLTPGSCRRLAAACCGVSLVASVAMSTTALADGGGPHHGCPAVCTESQPRLGGLPLPDLPVGSPLTRPHISDHQHPPEAAHSSRPTTLVVRHGDSLWALAQQRLPAGAPDAAVQALTKSLYAVNRAVIGDDPDLIIPGTPLQVPEGTS